MKAQELSLFYNKVFGIEEVKQIFGESLPSIKVQLSRLCKKKILIRLKRNCYTFREFYPDPLIIGQKMVMPSYYSLETVLSRRGIIPEGTTVYTLVTSRKTQRYTTPFGIFDYRHLGPQLFFGVDTSQNGVFMASAEKALLDYLYLNSSKFEPEFKCWQSERFDELDTLDWKQMIKWAPKFKMKKLLALVKNLREYCKSGVYQEHR